MSAYLANLLSKETNSFRNFIDDIEYATGCNKNDLKLASEIKITTKNKLRFLGLNPEDTTSSELYYSLNNLLKLHDKFIVKKFNINYGDPILQALKKITEDFNDPINAQSVFCVRSNILKKILVKNQPSKTIKLLGYRSFESMLKNEDPKTVLSLAYYVEPEAWRKAYFNQVKNLKANDFEFKNVKFIILDNSKFKQITREIIDNNRHNVISVENMGQILIAPLDSQLKAGFCVLTYAYIINRLKSMITTSAFTQKQQFNSNFGENIAKLLQDIDPVNFYISRYDFLWDAVIEHLEIQTVLNYDEKDDVQLLQNSNNVDQLNKILTKLEPALNFWFDSENLGYLKDGKIVSMNLLDVCHNFFNQLSLSDSSHSFMEMALNKSLVSRYLDSKVSNEQILKQISSDRENNDYMQIFKNRIVYS